jgi:hypothetical protein
LKLYDSRGESHVKGIPKTKWIGKTVIPGVENGWMKIEKKSYHFYVERCRPVALKSRAKGERNLYYKVLTLA